MGLGGGYLAVAGGAHLHGYGAGRGGAGALEYLGPGHGELHRLSGLTGEGSGDRLQVAAALTLASETAADLHRDDLDLGHVHAQDDRGVVTQGEVALAAAPDGDAVVGGVPLGGGRVRFDVSLVYRLGGELALDDNVGVGEALFQVASAELETVGNVGAAVLVSPAACPGVGAVASDQTLMERRRTVPGSVLQGQDGGQYLEFHVQQGQRLLGDVLGGRRHRGYGMAAVEGLFPGHDVAGVKPVVDRAALFLVSYCSRHLGEVGCGDHGFYPRQRQGAGRVDALDPRVWVGAAVQFAIEHPSKIDVRGIPRPSPELCPGHRAGSGACRPHRTRRWQAPCLACSPTYSHSFHIKSGLNFAIRRGGSRTIPAFVASTY